MGGVTRLCRSSATIVLAYWRSHGPLFLYLFSVSLSPLALVRFPSFFFFFFFFLLFTLYPYLTYFFLSAHASQLLSLMLSTLLPLAPFALWSVIVS
ncbi:hypothetical protein VDGL01_05142 [Verticillium dahliae]